MALHHFDKTNFYLLTTAIMAEYTMNTIEVKELEKIVIKLQCRIDVLEAEITLNNLKSSLNSKHEPDPRITCIGNDVIITEWDMTKNVINSETEI